MHWDCTFVWLLEFPGEMQQASRECLFYSHFQMQVESNASSNKRLNQDRWWLTAHSNTVLKCKRDSTGTHALQSKHCCLQAAALASEKKRKMYRRRGPIQCEYLWAQRNSWGALGGFISQLAFFYENTFMAQHWQTKQGLTVITKKSKDSKPGTEWITISRQPFPKANWTDTLMGFFLNKRLTIDLMSVRLCTCLTRMLSG